MPINTGVPTNIKRPGSFSTFLYTTALRGLVPLALRIGIVGMRSAAATIAAATPTQVFDPTDGDTKCGVGSEAALMVRKAFEQASLQGTQPEVWVSLIDEPGAGLAHAKTGTLSGPATADGNLEIEIAGRRIVVGVANGDSADTIAAALEKESDAKVKELPVTAGVAGAVVTWTHVTKGENGGDVDYTLVSAPAGVGIVFANGVVGTVATDITAALDALVDKDYEVIAIANRKAADITDAKAHTATQWSYGQKRYRWIVLGDPTTLSAANALGTAANDYTIIVAQCEESPSLPGEIAVAIGVRIAGEERPNANYNNRELALYPPPKASVYTTAEIESALSAGTIPLVPTDAGDRLKIVRMVTTKVTTNSAPDYATFDLATSRTAAHMARQIDLKYIVEFSDELMDADADSPENVLRRVKDMIVAIHRDFEALKVIRDVDTYVPQIQVVENGSVPGRIDVANKFRVISPLHQAAFVHEAQI